MPKSTVKQCVRPQCMQIWPEWERSRYCACGAPLAVTEIEMTSAPRRKSSPPPEKKAVPEKPVPVQEEVRTEAVCKKAALYLLLEDRDIRYDIAGETKIGRSAEGTKPDIDLGAYAGKTVSKEHAIIRPEQDGYYVINTSKNHSVRIIDADGNGQALAYGDKARLKTEDGILLSRNVLLQFVEEK